MYRKINYYSLIIDFFGKIGVCYVGLNDNFFNVIFIGRGIVWFVWFWNYNSLIIDFFVKVGVFYGSLNDNFFDVLFIGRIIV